MSEAEAIERARDRGPATRQSLLGDLQRLGVSEGSVLIVHTSLSQLGWVAGGPISLIDALCAAVGEAGTVVMPTQSGGLTDPANWQDPPVPESWWPTIRDQLPAFDPARTPTRQMGVVAEAFRSLPGVLRSDHPFGSFAALGPAARTITAEHPLEEVFGDRSPLGRLYDLRASVLLLGVGHANNTSLHLAEARAMPDRRRDQGSPVLECGRRVWKTYRERLHDSDDFPKIGEAYAAAGGTVRDSPIGAGTGTLIPMQEIVDFAVDWMVEREASGV